MKRHLPMPALRNVFLSAAVAVLAGVPTASSFAQTDTTPQAVPPTATQPAPAAPAAPAAPHVTQAGPASVADLAEGLIGAVVNISTSQRVKGSEGQGTVPLPQAPEGSPFQDFFDEFFKDRQGGEGGQQQVQSLGSGFVIDAAEGIVVTNNHVIDGADEIEVNFCRRLRADGRAGRHRHQDRPRGAQGRPDADDADGGQVRRFRQDAHRRLGDGDRQSVRARRHGDASASSRRATATSTPAPTTTSSRPTPRSTRAIPAVRCSTWTAR